MKQKKQQQQKEMKMNCLIYLPDDVLINKILLKLDLKSLMNLRCVCKYLRSLMTSQAFVKMHYDHQFNNNPLVFLVSGNNQHFYSLNFNGIHINPWFPEKVEIASGPLSHPHLLTSSFSRYPIFFGSCNGLLCLVAERFDDPPCLWNPTTKEYKELPPPIPSTKTPFGCNPNMIFDCSRVVSYGFGYDSIIDDYKVIQCENSIYSQYFPPFHNTDYTITEFQVYTLGTDTWKRIDDNPFKSHFTTQYHFQTPGMFVNGALHWIINERKIKPFGSKIIAFDIEKEIFRAEVPKPHSRLTDSSNDWLLHVLRGCLCIYERQEVGSRCIDVWMMKDYGVMESWTKVFTVDCLHPFSASSTSNFKVLNFCKNGEIIFEIQYGFQKQIILYNPRNKNHQRVDLGNIPGGGISYSEIYMESLVSLNTGVYRYGNGMY